MTGDKVMGVEYTLHLGDCLEVLPTLAANSVDAIVTDPPYGLGFMGKDWDHGVPGEHFWREALRVAKPGAHLLAFGGSRTYHRLAVAIEDAGWEIRDTIMWLYGSGFPKSLNVSTAIERQEISSIERQEISSIERQFCEWLRDCSGLTPDDLGTDRFHVQRIEIVNTATKENPRWGRRALVPTFEAWQKIKAQMTTTPPSWVEDLVKNPPMPPITHPGQWKSGNGRGTQGTGDWQGWGTALKPAHEPIIVARKPLQGTVAANVLQWGTGALNIDGCRVEMSDADREAARVPQPANPSPVPKASGAGRNGEVFEPHPTGRWPANLIHDGSEEVVGLFPRAAGASAPVRGSEQSTTGQNGILGHFNRVPGPFHCDSGSAARFFYCAKASKADRDAGCEGLPESRPHPSGNGFGETTMWNGENGDEAWKAKNPNLPRRNHHPTVKPTDLMRYLCRLVTPPNGVVLDPFMGSGSTGKAAMCERLRFIGVELSAEYVEIAKRRIDAAARQLRLNFEPLPEWADGVLEEMG